MSHFKWKKSQNFLGRGQNPSSDSFPSGEGTPPPHTAHPSRSNPPEECLATGLVGVYNHGANVLRGGVVTYEGLLHYQVKVLQYNKAIELQWLMIYVAWTESAPFFIPSTSFCSLSS